MFGIDGNNVVGVTAAVIGVTAEIAKTQPGVQKFLENKFGSNWKEDDNVFFFGWPMIVTGVILCFRSQTLWDMVLGGIAYGFYKYHRIKSGLSNKTDTTITSESEKRPETKDVDKQSTTDYDDRFPEVDEGDANLGSVAGVGVAAVVATVISDSDDETEDGDVIDGDDLSGDVSEDEVAVDADLETENQEPQGNASAEEGSDGSMKVVVEVGAVIDDEDGVSDVDTSSEEASEETSEDNSDSDSED